MLLHIKHVTLPVFDQQRALKFYTGKLGFAVVQDEPYGKDGWRWVEIKIPGAQTSIVFTKRADETPGDEPALVLIELDVLPTAAKLEDFGVEIVHEPQPAPWDHDVTWFWLRDTEGNIVMLQKR